MGLQVCLIEYCICKLHLQIAYNKHCISNIESYFQIGNTSANRNHRMDLQVCLTQFCFYTEQFAFANRKYWMDLQICLIEYCICKLELHMQIKIIGWICKFASFNLAFANPNCICKSESDLVCNFASPLLCQIWKVQQSSQCWFL